MGAHLNNKKSTSIVVYKRNEQLNKSLTLAWSTFFGDMHGLEKQHKDTV